MRTFTFSDAKSHKFWNIEVTGSNFTVTYGRIGTDGQTSEKTFASPAAAQKAADKLIAEKLGKGYRETTPSATTAAGPQGNRQVLEKAILADPSDVAAYAAYADLLTELGDPQGEFIQVQLALEDPSQSPGERKKLQQREKELLEKHQDEWVGPWKDLAPAQGPEDGLHGRQTDFPGPKPFRFIRGILAEVTIDSLTVTCAKAFATASQTRMVTRMFIGGFAYEEGVEVEEEDVDEDAEDGGAGGVYPSQRLLVRWPYFENLRVFQLGWTNIEEYQDLFCPFACHLGGDLAHHFVKQMPKLEELYLFAHRVAASKIFSQQLPNLRVLQLYHSTDYDLTRLAKNASMKNLEKILCHPHTLEYGEEPYIDLSDLKALARSPYMKNLKHLRLRGANVGDAGCKELVASKLLAQLETLDLRHGRVGDDGARMLAESNQLDRLKVLDLSRNELTAQGIASLTGLKANVDTSFQHQSTADMEDEDFDALSEVEGLFTGDFE